MNDAIDMRSKRSDGTPSSGFCNCDQSPFPVYFPRTFTAEINLCSFLALDIKLVIVRIHAVLSFTAAEYTSLGSFEQSYMGSSPQEIPTDLIGQLGIN
jgi:hypothetical protein